MKIKDVLAEMTDAEVTTWIEEAYAENYSAYSRDEMLDELVRLSKEGCSGLEGIAEREGREGLDRELMLQVGTEVLEDPADEQQVAEGMLVWLKETRAEQERK